MSKISCTDKETKIRWLLSKYDELNNYVNIILKFLEKSITWNLSCFSIHQKQKIVKSFWNKIEFSYSNTNCCYLLHKVIFLQSVHATDELKLNLHVLGCSAQRLFAKVPQLLREYQSSLYKICQVQIYPRYEKLFKLRSIITIWKSIALLKLWYNWRAENLSFSITPKF